MLLCNWLDLLSDQVIMLIKAFRTQWLNLCSERRLFSILDHLLRAYAVLCLMYLFYSVYYLKRT